MLRVQITLNPRARARARLYGRAYKRLAIWATPSLVAPATCGALVGIALAHSAAPAPAPVLIQRLVHPVIFQPAPTVLGASAPQESRPETSADAWDILSMPSFPDGLIETRKPRKSPKPPKREGKRGKKED